MIDRADRWGNTPDRPRHNNIGTLAQQMAAIGLSIFLGERRGTSARDEWDDARRLVIPQREVSQ